MNKKLFNIIGILLLSMVAFSFTACSEDDEDNAVKSSKLVGRWDDSCCGDMWVFNANGTGILYEYYGTYDEEREDFAYEYSEKTGTLKIHWEDEVEYYRIQFISNDSFKLYWDDEDYCLMIRK